jgi:prevent-host-death family protein
MTERTVSMTEFRKRMGEYVAAARTGGGPVAVTDGGEVVGVFLSPADYEEAYKLALRRLLRARMKGPTVSHDEAKARILKAARSAAKRP